MKIRQIQANLLEVPTDPPRASPAESRLGRKNTITTLAVQVTTDEDIEGIGFGYSLQGGGKAMKAIVEFDLGPLVLNENPLDPEGLFQKVYWRIQSIGRSGLVAQVYSALDLAFWDIRGKAAGKALCQLLGGERKPVEAYVSHTGWLWMTPGEIAEATAPYLEKKVSGLKVKVGKDLATDKARLRELHKILGPVWLAVDANEKYQLETAGDLGRFLQNEIGAAWFEEPLTCEDPVGHAQLANALSLPIAAGEMLFTLGEFQHYFSLGALDIAQPDVTRLGGITPFLKVVELCLKHGIPVSPHLLPEISLHFACAIPQVAPIEFMPWLKPLFKEYPDWVDGKLAPLPGAGLGLDFDMKAIQRFSVE
ncbi:MAG: mandelate racemase/muconate lactonizing enzyme family protein [Gemmataceae bacterium]|nr:mandelate racemase/muconate lactonizing enzyme family protein [Gemmataceae bacterium]